MLLWGSVKKWAIINWVECLSNVKSIYVCYNSAEALVNEIFVYI